MAGSASQIVYDNNTIQHFSFKKAFSAFVVDNADMDNQVSDLVATLVAAKIPMKSDECTRALAAVFGITENNQAVLPRDDKTSYQTLSPNKRYFNYAIGVHPEHPSVLQVRMQDFRRKAFMNTYYVGDRVEQRMEYAAGIKHRQLGDSMILLFSGVVLFENGAYTVTPSSGEWLQRMYVLANMDHATNLSKHLILPAAQKWMQTADPPTKKLISALNCLNIVCSSYALQRVKLVDDVSLICFQQYYLNSSDPYPPVESKCIDDIPKMVSNDMKLSLLDQSHTDKSNETGNTNKQQMYMAVRQMLDSLALKDRQRCVPFYAVMNGTSGTNESSIIGVFEEVGLLSSYRKFLENALLSMIDRKEQDQVRIKLYFNPYMFLNKVMKEDAEVRIADAYKDVVDSSASGKTKKYLQRYSYHPAFNMTDDLRDAFAGTLVDYKSTLSDAQKKQYFPTLLTWAKTGKLYLVDILLKEYKSKPTPTKRGRSSPVKSKSKKKR